IREGGAWPELKGLKGSFGSARFIIVRPSRPFRHDYTGGRTARLGCQWFHRFKRWKKWTDNNVLGRADEQLLVVYHERERHEQRMGREPQQRQRERQQQD
ncbi:hypothetical protein THIOM_002932, partial [Candidatus Thiomargarita nelsonii]